MASAPTTLLSAVGGRNTTGGGITAASSARLAEVCFACLASGPSRRRMEVVRSREDGEEWSNCAGGWPEDAGVFVVGRVRVGRGGASAVSLGRARVGVHRCAGARIGIAALPGRCVRIERNAEARS